MGSVRVVYTDAAYCSTCLSWIRMYGDAPAELCERTLCPCCGCSLAPRSSS